MFSFATADRLAANLMRGMEPACERIEIAGSIRRNRAQVKDIELVAIPKWEERPKEGGQAELGEELEMERVNVLHELLLSKADVIQPIKPSGTDVVAWHIKPDGRYWRLWLPTTQVKVDLFLTEPNAWGWTLVMRTGPAFGPSGTPKDGFTTELLRRWKKVAGLRDDQPASDGGYLRLADGSPLPTPEEATVFQACKVRYIAPEARFSAHDVKVNAL